MVTRAQLVFLWGVLAATTAAFAAIEGHPVVFILTAVLVVLGVLTAVGPGGDGDDNR